MEPLKQPITVDNVENRDPVDNDEGGTDCSERLLRERSIERYVTAGPTKTKFTLGVIELSDDGHVKDIDQKDQVFAELGHVARGDGKERADATSKGAILVVFVHGWHHRAKVCDENLSCFRRVLEMLANGRGDKAAPVFGLYLAWRG